MKPVAAWPSRVRGVHNDRRRIRLRGARPKPDGFGGRGDPIEFDGSDVAMSSTECCATVIAVLYQHYASTWGQPFEFPSLGGALVFPYINEGETA